MTRMLRWAAWAVARCYRAYYATLRLRGIRSDGSTFSRDYGDDRQIFSFCERDVLTAAGYWPPHQGIALLVAHGRDGDWASALVESLGYRVVRGSSSRGGVAALRELMRFASRPGESLAFVVDGPLGPAGRAKPGAVVCALESGLPLRAVGAAARHALVFPRTWSGIYLPLPFSYVGIVVGDVNLRGATRDDIPRLTEELTRALGDARARAVELTRGARW
jgi:lysophospholipid acyltransferase (LPLAT)-like uncharacterized protein